MNSRQFNLYTNKFAHSRTHYSYLMNMENISMCATLEMKCCSDYIDKATVDDDMSFWHAYKKKTFGGLEILLFS